MSSRTFLPHLLFAVYFPAVFVQGWADRASVESNLFLSYAAVLKISSKANRLCKRIAAFASLIGDAPSRFEHLLAVTSSRAGRRAQACMLLQFRDIVISFERGNCPGKHLNMEVFQLFWVWLQAESASHRLISQDWLTHYSGLSQSKCV